MNAAAREHPDRIWLRADGLELSYAEATAEVAHTRDLLLDTGVRRGDHVMLTARTEPRYLIALLAVTVLGGTAVPVNPRSTTSELAGLLAQLEAAGRLRAIVTDSELCSRFDNAPAPVVLVRDLSRTGRGGPVELSGDEVGEDDIAVMIPTSGTTGRSKLVMQTHRTHVLSGEGFAHWMGLGAEDRLMTCLPLFHTNALAYSTMGSLAAGAGLVLLPRFSASTFLDAGRRHGATSFNAVGAMLAALLAQAKTPHDGDNPLRTCYAAPAPPEREHREFEQRFGVRLICGYGLSESTYGLVWRPGTRPFGTLGWPRQHPTLGAVNEVRVVDEDGRDVEPGITGELLLRNPTVTRGYFGMPEETAQVVRDGWLHTGDLVASSPDGTYRFVARKKEVIRRRGENLAPAEVEEILLRHPGVADCGVVGVPAGLSEEEVKAFVVLATGVTVRELRDWAAEHLAAFKVPRFWQVVPEIPRTPTNRIARGVLAQGLPGNEVDLAPVVVREGT
ncbi:AMP-binding protein [Amycolatopsis sp. NPDC006131]|uniref:AMP-binding protein n=1 Tax=Amycolatopsis sp. NPDC006131 TaxID=3156731 RepID=UPI0033A5C3C0